jgi:hypothetical protein
MCNDYEHHVRWAEYQRIMQTLNLAIPSHQSELDLPQADDIRINDTGPVMRAAGDAIELVPMSSAFRLVDLAGHRFSISAPTGGISQRATAASSRPRPSSSLRVRSTRRRSTGSR